MVPVETPPVPSALSSNVALFPLMVFRVVLNPVVVEVVSFLFTNTSCQPVKLYSCA